MVETNVKMFALSSLNPRNVFTSRTTETLPEKAWTNVAVDFVGPFPTGEYLIVVIDEYSRYPEVEILTTTSAMPYSPDKADLPDPPSTQSKSEKDEEIHSRDEKNMKSTMKSYSNKRNRA
jgi:hypothetical protein